MNGKEQRQRCDCLLSAGELFHVTETLHGGHRMVLDTAVIGFLHFLSAPHCLER